MTTLGVHAAVTLIAVTVACFPERGSQAQSPEAGIGPAPDMAQLWQDPGDRRSRKGSASDRRDRTDEPH